MSGPRTPAFDTLALHAGRPAASARASRFDPAPAARRDGHGPDPANAELEERVAALEGGVAAIAAASSQAALHLGLATLAGAGGHVVAARTLHGAARSLLAHTLPRFGIDTTFVDPRDPDAWRAAIGPATRLLFGAALSGPGAVVLDIPVIAELAHAHDLPLLVDATTATPWLQRPVELGADLVLHAAGDYLHGQEGGQGGLLVDGGTFDWEAAHARSGRFATLCAPCPALDGLVCAEESTVGAFALRARHEGLHDFGAVLGGGQARAILQGIATLVPRMERHVAGARRLAAFLLSQPAVTAVAYPELDTHPDHLLARRLLPRGAGAMLAFDLAGGHAAARRCLAALRVFSRDARGGHVRSAAWHPASTTHAHLAPRELDGLGAGDGTLCLAVGLEDPDDLIDDLGRGLKLALKGG